MPEVDAEELSRRRVEAEPLGGPTAPGVDRGIGLGDDDRAPGQQVARDLGDRRAGEPDALASSARLIAPAVRRAVSTRFSCMLLVSACIPVVLDMRYA
jgi:hypothetical protein